VQAAQGPEGVAEGLGVWQPGLVLEARVESAAPVQVGVEVDEEQQQQIVH